MIEVVESTCYSLLAHPVQHPAERLVVEDQDSYRKLGLYRGHQGMHRHRETAVAAYGQNRTIRDREAQAEGRRYRITHAAARRRLQVAGRRLGPVPVHHEQPVLTRVASDDPVLRESLLQEC